MSGCGCESFGGGHNCHPIQVRRAKGDPTSWFLATVTRLQNEHATLQYEDRSACKVALRDEAWVPPRW